MDRLSNSRWGFESNCFVCEATNPAVLGLEFYADRVGDADLDGAVCTTASATFVPLGPAHAVDAIGEIADGDDARYVRNDREVLP